MKFLVHISLLLFSFSLFAQKSQPVKWSFEAKKIGNTEYEVIFTADAEAGWYVYSQHLDEGGPIPTSFEYEQDPSIEFIGRTREIGKKKEGFDALFGMKVISFAGKTNFIQKIKVTNETAVVKGYLTFMTCNGENCLPPTDIDFKIPLK